MKLALGLGLELELGLGLAPDLDDVEERGVALIIHHNRVSRGHLPPNVSHATSATHAKGMLCFGSHRAVALELLLQEPLQIGNLRRTEGVRRQP